MPSLSPPPQIKEFSWVWQKWLYELYAILQGYNSVIQVVNVQDGAVATGTTVIPEDDTIPQNTDGDEYITLAITPTNASNTLKIEVVANISHSAGGEIGAWLFQDSAADSLGGATAYQSVAAHFNNIKFTHYMTAGTVSATTFKVRCGCPNSGTTTFNGEGGVRRYGGVMASSITITEYKASL